MSRAAVELSDEQLDIIARGGIVIVEVPLHEIALLGLPFCAAIEHAAVHEGALLLAVRRTFDDPPAAA